MAKRGGWRKSAKAGDVDEYLAALPDDQRAALEKLRRTIKAAAPEAKDGISYRIPMFKHRGKILVGFHAATEHCTFDVTSVNVMRAHAKELEGYGTGKGSIRFPADKPLPAGLVKKLVKARIAEIESA
jgi:uncharacterized protein YdhG (YjbR/CyaY superfamily)